MARKGSAAPEATEPPPIQAGIKRANFIRLAALEWVRHNKPDVMAQIEAEAARLYPYTQRRKRKANVDLSFIR